MSGLPVALVVEDSDDQAGLLRRYLERSGCDVVVAASGEKALELLETVSPVLAIVDLILPGISGEEFAEHLRRTHPDCLLAITSVHDATRYPEADAVLPKPFTGAQVAAVAERAIGSP
ncbi:response regulator transcription factor [Protaetiibacter mangrovi]|uniref:Response regulator n=1 Tax=Protaetiibacter mangrovi TaxID=2970926 RepID=A0ABT1ZGZ8_9MICO|nr:response regulator [Protaetiibacter mangrovi]MCS0499991.1 response regulator [Protaetiibacter mangrovi]TPX02082.1 response regulator [Schumannella luteola]